MDSYYTNKLYLTVCFGQFLPSSVMIYIKSQNVVKRHFKARQWYSILKIFFAQVPASFVCIFFFLFLQ